MDSVEILTVARAFRLVTCHDSAVKEIPWACVGRVGKRKVGFESDEKMIADTCLDH